MSKPIAPPSPEAPTDSDSGPVQDPPRRSAMRLPDGVKPARPGGPSQGRQSWNRGQGGRPQKDAERRAGKSRKVH